MYEYRAKVKRVVDADTFDLDVDLGLFVHVHERVRLAYVDAWEVRGEEREKGKAATEAVRKLLEATNGEVVVRTKKDKKGKYGRFIVEMYVGMLYLNDWIVQMGHGEYKEY